MKRLIAVPAMLLFALGLAWTPRSRAQGLDNISVLNDPPTDMWPTYNGDYSGRRYSPLDQINEKNVKSLALAWAFQTGTRSMETMPLEVNGTMYITGGNEMWAVDALTGREIWHFMTGRPGGSNKGAAIYKDKLYMTTPDDNLLCIDAKTGKELWKISIDDPTLKAFGGSAPLVVKDHIIVGTGGDTADLPGFLLAVDPDTGKVQWRFDVMPKPGTPAWNTWPHNTDVVTRGGGMTWITGTYDPKLNLLYWGTGNPHPVENGAARVGANLYTCSIVALDPDTGKLVWYFQGSPHDTHDWDMNMTPVLFNGTWHGKPRELLAQAGKNGMFFVLDRTNGKDLLSESFVHTNWYSGLNERGEPIPDPIREPQPDGTLVWGSTGTDWQAPSFDPGTGLFYVNSQQSFGVFYLTMPGIHAEGWAGRDFFLYSKSMMKAIDYQTGKIKWVHDYPGREGLEGVLSTAGHLVFTGASYDDVIALDASTGKTVWHTFVGSGMNTSPMTYELFGRQYVVFPAGGTVFAFALPSSGAAGAPVKPQGN